jgi:hypothetical protein
VIKNLFSLSFGGPVMLSGLGAAQFGYFDDDEKNEAEGRKLS